MKKVLFIILTLFVFLLPIYVQAATITETEYSNGRISIDGTGEGEIQIVLFGLDDLPLYMTTVAAESGVFSITLPEIDGLSEGTYTVKISDYDGTNISTDIVEVTAESNPQTFDNIMLYIAVASICLIGIITSIFIYKKTKEHN
ncbi:MAG: hypothetical protein WDA21_00795 [Bacilli bacterium]